MRRKLGLKTYRRAGNYYIAESEKTKLEKLIERYGLTEPEEPTVRKTPEAFSKKIGNPAPGAMS
jgi:hypothetical protein